MDKIFEKIGTYVEPIVELQRQLVAIPALSPSSGGEGEYDKVMFLREYLEKNFTFDDYMQIDVPDEKAKNGVRPSLIAKYNGNNAKRTVWFIAHTDIVPPGELSLWDTDPYKLERKGNMIYGRGVEDNHQGLCASLFAVKALMELGIRPDCNVALLFAADEECGSYFGLGDIAKNKAELFGKDDLFVIPDGGNEEGTMIEVAEKSIMWLRFKTTGKQCHGSSPDKGVNAFVAASDLVMRLQKLKETYSGRDEIYDPPYSTFEPTKKEGNVPNVNTIPGDDVFHMDCRVMPMYNLDDVQKTIRDICDGVEKDHGVKVTFDSSQEVRAPSPTPNDALVVTLAARAIKDVWGVDASPMGIGGGTVASFLRRLNLQAIVYSKLGDAAHKPNEYCNLDNLIGDSRVFAHIIMNCK